MIGRGSLLRRWSRSRPAPSAFAEGETIEATARSHVGRVRQINEDRFLVRSDRGLWAVADGMGGHTAGTEAADTAVEELAGVADGEHAISEAALHAALVRANRRIHAGGGSRQGVSGTTIVVAWLLRDRLTVLWAGDSRAYRIRTGEARCLTRDHSVIQELLDAGEITEAEAERHPYAHLVTRALGASDTVDVDRIEVDFRPGDRLLLCSDGVSRSLDLAGVTRGSPDMGQFADDVISGALRRDGSDNATVVAIQLNALLPA